MSGLPAWLRSNTSGVKITIVLLVVLAAVNAAAVWTIFVSRRNVQEMARQDLHLQTTAQARAIEALLATLRGDFVFLAQSPPLSSASSVLGNPNPLVRRWGRLDIEGSFLRYLMAHPEVSRLVLRDPKGKPIVAAAHRDGVPVLLPPGEFATPAEPGPGFWTSDWQIGEEGANGSLETVLQISELLRFATPGAGQRVEILPEGSSPSPASAGSLVASAPIRAEQWSSPIRWTLVRTENQSQLISSVASLAAQYRSTTIVNLLVISLTLVLGGVAFRQVRRSAMLEAENQHQARVRELERQMLHSERLASVGRLAAGLAHEINNPLEGMSNYLSLLEQDLQERRTEGCLELAVGVREGLNRVAAITRQVLALSDPGRSPKQPVELNAIVKETFAFVRSNPAFRLVRLELKAADQHLVLMGNAITLGQVVLNLILNACEHQDAGGIVTVELARAGRIAVLQVSDRGPGIPEEALPRIFEPFFSTRGSTGLGLSLCHSIVTGHSGEITAENRTDGAGARFTVRLPLADEGQLKNARAELDASPSEELEPADIEYEDQV
jgi:two-component system NtrC family sensor kinase